MPQFQYNQAFLLLVLIPIIAGMFLYAQQRKKKLFRKIGDPKLVIQLLGPFNAGSSLLKLILSLFAAIMLILAMANLRVASNSENIRRSGIDVMVALDVSKSMLAQDLKPSRLDRAKLLVNKLIDRLGNNKIGLVIFAGKAYLQMPLTDDLEAARMYLSSANTESVPTQGTVIAEALNRCNISFNEKEKKYKVVLLLTDGEDHDKGAVDIAQQMASQGVVILTVGIGSAAGASIPDESTGQNKLDAQGNVILSSLNEQVLRSIALKGNGQYKLFTNTEDVLSMLENQIFSMEKRPVKDESLVNYNVFFQVFLIWALIFLLAELFFSENNRILKQAKILSLGLFVFLSPSAFAQDNKAWMKTGNEYYKKNNFTEAILSYNKVLEKNPEDAIALYNLGNALFKSRHSQDAIEAYEKSISGFSSNSDKSNAFFNKGVVLQQSDKLNESIEAYKEALKLDPTNEDARHNLQALLQQRKKKQDLESQQKNAAPQKPKKEQRQQEPQKSRMTKNEAEEKLKALSQKERNLLNNLPRQGKPEPKKPEKDW
jgi:Ca-activated chloride channel family protein